MLELILGAVGTGLGVINTGANICEGVVLKRHGKSIDELKGQVGTAATAYNMAAQADQKATAAVQQATAMQTELVRKQLIPEPPKDPAKIQQDAFAGMAQFFGMFAPQQPAPQPVTAPTPAPAFDPNAFATQLGAAFANAMTANANNNNTAKK